MGACLRKPPSAPVVIEAEDAPATALAPDDLTKPPNALHVRIIRCRDLPAVDTNLLSKNSSDPYVLLECCGERARTTTKKQNLNPDYGEAFLLSRDEDEPLSLIVMDADVLSADDLMCSCTVRIRGREPVKAWYDLTHKGEQKGRIQVVTHLVYDGNEFSERARLPAAGDGPRPASCYHDLLSARRHLHDVTPCSRRWREGGASSMRVPSPRSPRRFEKSQRALRRIKEGQGPKSSGPLTHWTGLVRPLCYCKVRRRVRAKSSSVQKSESGLRRTVISESRRWDGAYQH